MDSLACPRKVFPFEDHLSLKEVWRLEELAERAMPRLRGGGLPAWSGPLSYEQANELLALLARRKVSGLPPRG